MTAIFKISLTGLLAGVLGTAAGGLLSGVVRRPKNTMVGALMAISGGIMLVVVFQDLIPEAIMFGSIVTTGVGTMIGLGAMRLLDRLVPDGEAGGAPLGLARTGVLLGIGIAMHNLPEGLAIGAGYAAASELGLGLALVIALHNIPEGLAMAGPMRGAGMRLSHVVRWTAAAGVPMGIGAALGAWFGGVSPMFLSISLGFASGAMIYIIFNQLLPDAKKLGTLPTASMATVAGMFLGYVMIYALGMLP